MRDPAVYPMESQGTRPCTHRARSCASPRTKLLKGSAGLLLTLAICSATVLARPAKAQERLVGTAVEFTDHAACAYVAKHMGWYEEAGLTLSAYESYVTGMALAAALGRGDIQAAYMCLVPAINAYANGGIPIKVVAGTHKHGYGLVVDPDKVSTVADLEKPGLRIGCVREGGAVDVLLHRVIDKYNLDERRLLSRVQRMNPPKQVLALKMGKLDGAFLPEHHATLAESLGFKMLVKSQDVWPNAQGSVLVVKEELIEDHPDIVRKLVQVSRKATQWINENPYEAAEVTACELSISAEGILPKEVAKAAGQLEITPDVVAASMKRLAYTTDLDRDIVQETIDYMKKLGYIRQRIRAEEILETRFLK